jgi:hypothetical protein
LEETMRHCFGLATAAAASLVLIAPAAWAQDRAEASASPKGIVGGALLGAEVVTLTEAALDVQPAWAYIIGGAAGAVAGGVGGFFIDESDNPKLSMLLLAGGMALILPTTVAVLSATAYEPPADYVQDRGPTDEPVAEPPQPDMPVESPAPPVAAPGEEPTGALRRRQRSRAAALTVTRELPPPAVLAYDGARLTLSVPAVEVRDVYTPAELHQYGVAQKTELRVPVLNLCF